MRRLALFIEESLFRGTKWVVFEPNDEPLWAQIRMNIGAFMQDLFRKGAFQGTTPREAYLVRCDKTEHLYRITAKLFCDCTGDSRLALEAGADMRYGREARAEFGESLD